MTRKRTVLAALFAIAGAVVAVQLLIHRVSGPEEGQVAALQSRVDALQGQVAAPQPPGRVLGTLDRSQHGTPPGMPVQPPMLRSDSHAIAMPGEQAPPPFADAEAAAERRRYEAGVLEQTLSTQRIDVAASNTFSEGLKQAFSGEAELAGNRIVDAQCRATLCRIALLQPTEDDVESFLGNVGSLPGMENTETYWQRELNPDGSSSMTMYVARQGHKLPDYQTHAAQGLANRSNP